VSSKAAILSEIALSRTAVKQASEAVRHELDYPTKVKNSVRSNPFAWLGGAALVGYILAGPKTKVKTVYKKGRPAPPDAKGRKGKEEEAKAVRDVGFFGILAAAVRFVFPLVKPALQSFLMSRATGWLAKVAR
jgi:hypothetical protein